MRIHRNYRGALRTKRHKGTFSLSNQVVLRHTDEKVLDGIKVLGIHLDAAGIKRGHIRVANQTMKVEQLGKLGWKTLPHAVADFNKHLLRQIANR